MVERSNNPCKSLLEDKAFSACIYICFTVSIFSLAKGESDHSTPLNKCPILGKNELDAPGILLLATADSVKAEISSISKFRLSA